MGDRAKDKRKLARTARAPGPLRKQPHGPPVALLGKVAISVPPPEDDRLSWRFALLSSRADDRWSWYAMTREQAVGLHAFLCDMEAHTWRSAGRGTGNRPRLKAIPIEAISGEAQRELSRRLLDDNVEELWELHKDGPTRLWGIRQGSVFRAIWFDPNHEVCPSGR